MQIRLLSTVIILTLILLASSVSAQQSTTGPEPAPGIDRGLRLEKSQSGNIIPGVPIYIWQHGCGPTAVGMVIGYWDSHGRPDLISGDASTQTSAVNAMMADDSDDGTCGGGASDHFQDYSCPEDYYPSMQPDRSELGGAHSNDCVADFMHTSRSADNNYYGWSWFSDVSTSFISYIDMVDPDANPQAQRYYYASYSFEQFKAQIDNDHPVVLLVDTDGNGSTDHFVTAIGYDDGALEYVCYDTWNSSTHWYQWRPVAPGNTWGIYGVITFKVAVPPEVVSVTPSPNQVDVSRGDLIEVSFIGDMDESSIDESSFIVRTETGRVVSGMFSFETLLDKVTFDPTGDFGAGEVVTVTLTTAIQSLGAISLDTSYTWRFTVGVEQSTGNFASPLQVSMPCNSYSLSVADFDGTNGLDLAVGHYNCSEYISILLNDGEDSLIVDSSYMVTARPYSVEAGDLNDDGYVDLVVTGRSNDELEVFLNLGDGSFVSDSVYSIDDEIQDAILADFDGDGILDVAVPFGNPVAAAIAISNGIGDGTFGSQVYHSISTIPSGVVAEDFDSDGDLDLAVLNVVPPDTWLVSILFNNGFGDFGVADDYFVGAVPQALRAGDLDGDYSVDLVVSTLDGGLTVLLNNGNGSMSTQPEITVAPYIGDLEVADLDGDGDLDIASSHLSVDGTVTMLANNGDASFDSVATYSVGSYPAAIVSGDLDGDGRLDLITANSGSSDISVLFNLGCCGLYYSGRTGNVNCSDDEKVTLSDITTLIDHVYISKASLCCHRNANVNGSEDNKITLSDITTLIDHVYISKAPTELCR